MPSDGARGLRSPSGRPDSTDVRRARAARAGSSHVRSNHCSIPCRKMRIVVCTRVSTAEHAGNDETTPTWHGIGNIYRVQPVRRPIGSRVSLNYDLMPAE